MLRHADINRQLNQWLAESAHQRRHRTHGEIVYERFQRDKQLVFSYLP
ncbi:hypothetical protein M8009_11405 [Halomonas sp. ATCH28]|uniref:Transposase n=1 Tax=Halomonas gemina TaxID=2945105 RepID=A0ABT0T312_9GAMM|nr:hypothetical protein [Halomonas gemina]MCL7940896.1 hypothetical protein [Halomonas gemina]